MAISVMDGIPANTSLTNSSRIVCFVNLSRFIMFTNGCFCFANVNVQAFCSQI